MLGKDLNFPVMESTPSAVRALASLKSGGSAEGASAASSSLSLSSSSAVAAAAAPSSSSSSRYKGVSCIVSKGRWAAQIQVNGKKTHLGYFHDEADAARKYDEHAAANGRSLNFPPEGHAAVKGGRGGSSRFTGVSLYKQNGRWEAGIKVNGKKKMLGSFADEEEAARKCVERQGTYCAALLSALPATRPGPAH